MFRVVVFIVAMHAIISTAFAASFGCNPSLGNGVCPEAVICGLSELSKLDERVDSTYQRLLRQHAGGSAERLKSDQSAWLASRNDCGCDSSCIAREYQRRAAELGHIDARPQAGIPLEAIGVWALSRSECNLYNAGRLDREFSNKDSPNIGIIDITDSNIQWMNWGAAVCVISTSKMLTSKLSISFPAQCNSGGRESGQFVIVNMHGINYMRLSFLAKIPFFKSANYVRCAANQATSPRSLDGPQELRTSALHQKRRRHHKRLSGLRRREQRAMRSERNSPSGPRRRSQSAEKHKSKQRKAFSKTSWSNF
jgi:uncharacterized protein